MKTLLSTAVMFAAAAMVFTGCCDKGNSCQTATNESTTMATKAKFTKKYTNADFYKDGVFQTKVAEQAFREMFEHYGYQVTPELEKNWWFADFGLGDFENCGMGGVFWVNDSVNGYFAHDIYLLPSQMIPEHSHVKTKFPAKVESWMVNYGWAYNFSEVGDPTEGAEAIIPASQLATTKSRNYIKQIPGPIVNLADKGIGTWHFLCAGDEGAIVHEYANYHDGAGLKFSNPKAGM